MKLNAKRKQIINQAEADGYVWLSHLSHNAVMRFRYKTKRGFKEYVKIDGLTFLTKELAKAIESGTKSKTKPRMTYVQQVAYLEKALAKLELELYETRGKSILGIENKISDELN